ncbi:IS3 family transposase [Paenibacillus motobuensis]|uniref:Integrase catalytic domain-containing protein n=1 Tax=Paenibacillus motobuensis TaxID=295324 RepID=A0ABN0YK82_9BACL
MVSHLESGGVQEKRQVVEALREQFTVKQLCEYLQLSRSGYYQYLKRQSEDPDKELKERIQAIYVKRQMKYGYRRIQGELEREGWKVNHKKILRLMQVMGIRSIIRRKRKSKPQGDGLVPRIAENLLQRNFTAEVPDRKWVTDITQYAVGDTSLYLSAIKDLCTKEIVAYQMSFRNDTKLVLETFKQAFIKKEDMTGLIVHSDQGCQYTSHAYHDMLPQVGAQISMSRRGNCFDNAAMESFFSHLKTEALYPYDIRNIDEAQRRIVEFIRFYNEERIQLKLKKLTPVEYRRQFTA